MYLIDGQDDWKQSNFERLLVRQEAANSVDRPAWRKTATFALTDSLEIDIYGCLPGFASL